MLKKFVELMRHLSKKLFVEDKPQFLGSPRGNNKPQFIYKTDRNENLIPIEGEPNHFLVVGTPRPGKRILGVNPISNFGLAPDETLAMLSIACNYRLTDEQASIAKLSAMELLSATNIEPTTLDLVDLWQDTPALADFADCLRKNLLPS